MYRLMIFNHTSFLADLFRLFSRITPGRLINWFMITISYCLTRVTNKLFLWGYPFSISIETSSVCNLNCPECLTGLGHTRRIKRFICPDQASATLHLNRRNAFYCNLYSQGEPFLHEGLYKIIGLAKKLRYYSVISTNGHFLTEENCQKLIENGLDRLIISIDGIDAETYVKYRKGGNFEIVINGLKRLSDLKIKAKSLRPLVVIQFLVHRLNEHQLTEAPTFFKNFGADILQFKSMQFYTPQGIFRLAPGNPKYNRYLKKHKKFQEVSSNPCFRVWSHGVYNSDNVLVPCCFDKIPLYGIGSEQHGQQNMWKSRQFQEFRILLLTNPSRISICKNCVFSDTT